MEEYAESIRTTIPDATVELARTPGDERRLAKHAPVITGVGLDDDILSQAQELKLFACVYSGCDHLPIDRLRERDVAVTNAAGIHAPGIAEQILGYMLVFSRNLHRGWRRKQNNEWRHYKGRELTGSTVTIVGMGSIGQTLTRRLDGFDVKTIGIRYTPSKETPTDEVIGLDDHDAIHGALARTDYLVLASPLTDQTRGLISKSELITLPPRSVVVNIARGPILDTDAVLWALHDESIRGAALDVTDPEPLPEDHPLWTLQNVLITPHMDGHTPKHWERLAEILAQNYEQAIRGGRLQELRNQVVSP